MQTENEKAILDAVAGCPGASAGEIARHLGMDRCNTRRDLKKLWRDGKVAGQGDGWTLRFFPVGGAPVAGPVAENAVDNYRLQQDGIVKAERSHYFDVGVNQIIVPGLTVGLDGYYKLATNLIARDRALADLDGNLNTIQ